MCDSGDLLDGAFGHGASGGVVDAGDGGFVAAGFDGAGGDDVADVAVGISDEHDAFADELGDALAQFEGVLDEKLTGNGDENDIADLHGLDGGFVFVFEGQGTVGLGAGLAEEGVEEAEAAFVMTNDFRGRFGGLRRLEPFMFLFHGRAAVFDGGERFAGEQ